MMWRGALLLAAAVAAAAAAKWDTATLQRLLADAGAAVALRGDGDRRARRSNRAFVTTDARVLRGARRTVRAAVRPGGSCGDQPCNIARVRWRDAPRRDRGRDAPTTDRAQCNKFGDTQGFNDITGYASL